MRDQNDQNAHGGRGEREREESSHLCEDRRLFLWFMHPTESVPMVKCLGRWWLDPGAAF